MNVKKCTKCGKGFYLSGFAFCPCCGIPLIEHDEALSDLCEWNSYSYREGVCLSVHKPETVELTDQ